MVALNNLGTCLRRLEHYEEALASFEQAVAQSADFLPARYNLGTELSRVGLVEEAVAQFIRIIEAPPEKLTRDKMLETRDSLANALLVLGRLTRLWRPRANEPHWIRTTRAARGTSR